jgi:hypothetical protein
LSRNIHRTAKGNALSGFRQDRGWKMGCRYLNSVRYVNARFRAVRIHGRDKRRAQCRGGHWDHQLWPFAPFQTGHGGPAAFYRARWRRRLSRRSVRQEPFKGRRRA